MLDIYIAITSFVLRLKIENYKLIIKKKKKKLDKIVLLAKSKLNSIEVLVFKVLIDLVISHDEFVWINNVQKQ